MSEPNGHGLITRDFSFAAKRKTIDIYIPELERTFRLRALGVGQVRALTNDFMQQLSLMIVDENDQRVFTTEEDIQNLSEMSRSVADLLIEAVAEVNGVSKAAMEEAIKNFKASQSGDSASA